MWRIFTFFLFLLFAGGLKVSGQIITINPVEAGPYGPNSTIAVSIKINDANAKLRIDNVFKLFISDASGSFSGEKEIGSYPGFYTTFINGVIPTNLPAGNYKLRIKNSSTATISAVSNVIAVSSGIGVTADIDAATTQVITNNPKTFGVCRPENASVFRFTNASTLGANVTARFTNELNPADINDYSFESSALNVTAELTHYTIYIKAVLNGVIGTKACFLINNSIKPGFNPPANNTVCLPAILQYDIETNSSNGIQNNFPGYSYQINWGDDAIENITPNQVIAAGGKVKHTYNRSSCGKQIKINDVNYYNVFGIIYQVNSPFCGLISVPLSTQAKVITQPENRFSLGTSVCINTDLIINNTSITGDNPRSDSPECSNNEIVYYWFVDGKSVTPQGVPLSYTLNHKFSTPGFHTIRLESESNTNCKAAPIEKKCYVQEAPKPAFILSETITCVGAAIKVNDQSIVDLHGSAQNNYNWVIKGATGVSFVNGTSNTSKNPEFKFTVSGIYILQLTITSPCGEISSEQTVVINNTPEINLKWQNSLCGKGQLLNFNNQNGNPVRTDLIGSARTENDTYNWQISGGAFSFVNNTSSASKEPSIVFEDYTTYTITITHKNNCGSETKIQKLLFQESATVSAGQDQEICAGNAISLNGSITNGNFIDYKWLGGNGSFSPSRIVLNPVYTPTAEEITSGEVHLKLQVNTQNAAPCNLVEDLILIKIKPINKIISEKAKTICTNTPVNYLPIALLEGSTISWTATGSSNASGFSASGSGEIKDLLINTNPLKNASVTYTIIPNGNNCTGEPFTFIVTITASPKLKVTAVNSTICSGKESKIILTSNLEGMRYIWTSVASDSIMGNSIQNTPLQIESINDVLHNSGNTAGFVTYTITPESSTGCAGEPIVVKIFVSASQGIATFSPDKTTGCSPLSITFNNSTKGSLNTYRWDFGDGHTLVTTDNKSISHIYISSVTKTYTAKLITETDCGSYTSEYNIRVSPNTVQPELVVNANEYEGCAPHTVKFFNNSKGALRFKYDFGDGTIIETNRSPENIIHTFIKGGTYQVKLTASNGCSDTTTTETITVFPQAITDFSADKTEGCSSVTAKFHNKSIGALSYLWDFGDGTISTEINPVRLFSDKKPSYNVSLITTSSFGCKDTLEFIDFIKVSSPPDVTFKVLPGETIQYPNYRFSFKDQTPGEVKSRVWDFGDGNTSSLLNPEHSYPDTGIFKVKLTVSSLNGCEATLIKTVRITGTPGSLFVPNAFMPNSLTEELRTFKVKGSGIENWHFRVFNKWGQMIWQTKQLDEKGMPVESWDGTMFGVPAPQGIYFWEAGAKFKNGTEWPGMSYKSLEPKKTGTINLIR